MTKYFLSYQVPPIVWMAFIFPTNWSLTHDSTSRIIVPILIWLLPNADPGMIAMVHTALRKAGHFLGYGFLAFLLFRAFRGDSRGWKPDWIFNAGIISFAYAAIDESIQAFLPCRSGQFMDWMINAAGVVCTLGIIMGRRTRESQKVRGTRSKDRGNSK